MSSQIMKELKVFNSVMKSRSWKTYLRLLETVVRSNKCPDEALRTLELFQSGNIRQGYALADSMVAQSYSTPASHFAANQFANLVRKFPFTDRNPFDPEREALSKFLVAEQSCDMMNYKMSTPLGSYEQVLWDMRHFTRYVLGDCPDLQSIFMSCDFGPGAAIGVHGNATNLGKKLSSSWSVSDSAFSLAMQALSFRPNLSRVFMTREDGFYEWSDSSLRTSLMKKTYRCNYNKISFVPKTAKTHRSIAVEPLLNSYLQKGVDVYMRRKLKRVGFDLSDQESNSYLAMLGSQVDDDESFCTIDLESASDSISIGLVKHLLPPEWYDLLDRIRSPAYLYDGVITPYSKFCSMGNGFCFPLETLIFASACHAAGAKRPGIDFLVYGDDIVIRRKYAARVLEILRFFGFSNNSRKTFIEGPFRESCGRDWFGGVDVRPYILDHDLDSFEALVKMHNLTFRNERTSMFFAETRSLIRELVPSHIRLVRPQKGSPGGAFEVELDEFMSSPFARRNKDMQCWSWTEFTKRAVADRQPYPSAQDDILMYAALNGASAEMPYAVRRLTSSKIRRVVHS